MPREVQISTTLQSIDVMGVKGKIKSILTERNEMEITLRKPGAEVEYKLSRTTENYNAMASTLLLAYSMGQTVSLGLSGRNVLSVGVGTLTVRPPIK